MANGTFTPQPIIQSRADLGRRLLAQAGQGQRSTAGLSPFANLLQGLQGGLERGQATSAARTNQALQAEATRNIGEALARGDFNAASAAALGSGVPTLAGTGVTLAGQGAQARARTQLTPFQEKDLELRRRTVRAKEIEAGIGVPDATGTGGVIQAGTGTEPARPAESPKVRRARMTARVKAEEKEAATIRDLRRGGTQVLRAVKALKAKIGDPTSKDPAERKKVNAFERSTGPFVGGDTQALGVRSTAEGVTQSGREFGALFSEDLRKDLSRLEVIKQDAQAINSLMNRALLKGQGQVTEAEREDINRILGAIARARDATAATELLTNFEGIVHRLFNLPDKSGAGSTTPRPAPAPASPAVVGGTGSVQAGGAPQPTPQAIQALRDNQTDANIEAFNRHFGPGAAELALGVQ